MEVGVPADGRESLVSHSHNIMLIVDVFRWSFFRFIDAVCFWHKLKVLIQTVFMVINRLHKIKKKIKNSNDHTNRTLTVSNRAGKSLALGFWGFFFAIFWLQL